METLISVRLKVRRPFRLQLRLWDEPEDMLRSLREVPGRSLRGLSCLLLCEAPRCGLGDAERLRRLGEEGLRRRRGEGLRRRPSRLRLLLYGLKPCEKPVASPRISAPVLAVMALSPSGASLDQPLFFTISARNSSTSLSLLSTFARGPSFLSLTLLAKSLAWSLDLQTTNAPYRVAPLLLPSKLTPSMVTALPATCSNHW
mmetsp:Transcript_130726/g.364292  ORF Transcript_130726/g.364292 Transcript_130726/m.364292 type:complete len:201 (+) Transcript_130726:52-654(+)